VPLSILIFLSKIFSSLFIILKVWFLGLELLIRQIILQIILQISEMSLGQDIPKKKILATLYCTSYFLMCFKFSKYKKTEFQTMSWV
jgi:chromate transport protein ChrA